MDLKSKNGNAGVFETVAKWTVENPGGGKEVKQRTGTFTAAHSPATFVEWLGGLAPGLDDEGIPNVVPGLGDDGRLAPVTLGYAYECFLYGLDLKVKAKLRPATAAESPWISRDGVRINLATGERVGKDGKPMAPLALDKVIGAVQRAHDEAAELGGDPSTASVVARRMLIEAGHAVERNGRLTYARK